MAFGRELQDFVSGFTTGYNLIKSKDEKEWEKEKRQMARDDHSRVRERDAIGDQRYAEEFDYRRGRDAEGDRRYGLEFDWRRNRAGVEDERVNQGVRERAEERELRRHDQRLKMREGTGGGIPDEVDNFQIQGSYDDWRGQAIPDDTSGSTREESAIPSEEATVQLASLGGTSNDGGSGGSSSWLSYANQNATRNMPMSKDLESALEQVLPGMGVRVEVFSGGQKSNKKGEGTGSVRHNHGNSIDARFYDAKTGRRLNWANAEDRPIFQEIVRRGKAAGITGWGAGPGYMGEGTMHVGFGKPGVWGKGGKGKNSPQWLKDAYYGTAAVGAARGGLISAIPDDMQPSAVQDDDEILDDDGDGIPDEPVEVAQALPEEGPVPGRRPQYEGVSDDTGAEADDRPTDDPYETARRAVREGMKTAISQGKMDAQEAINDPETQKYQERYLRGYGAAPQQVVKQMMDKIDPERKMSPTERNMLAYANTYRFFYERGEPEKAKEAAVSLLQYHRQAAQQYLALGQAAAQNGDLDTAAEAAVKAYANIPNGRDMQIKKTNGGYEISVTDVKTGKPVTRQVVSPEQFAAQAAGFNPGTFDQEILNAAGVAPNEYSDASLEDRGTVAESASAAAGDRLEDSGLDEPGINAIRDIATDIAAVKENGIDPEQAVRFAAALIDAPADAITISPERGVPGKVRISFNGEEYVMSRNQVTKLRKLGNDVQTRKTETAAKEKADAKWWADQTDALKKGVAAFGGAIVEPADEAKQEENRQRQENIRRARGNMGVIPE